MNESEIKSKFPRAIAANADALRSGNRTRSKFQKFKDDSASEGKSAGDVDNRSEETKVDGEMCAEYGITVTLLVSDNRDRDGDGAFSTLQDCIIRAVGRLAKVDSKAQRILAASLKRPRRGGNNNNENQIKLDV